MKFLLCVIAALLLLPMSTFGETRTQSWTYSGAKSMPEDWGGLKLSVTAEVKTPDGAPSLEIVPEYNRDDQEWPAHLRYPARGEMLKGATTVAVNLWVKGDANTRIALRVTSARSAHFTATRSYDLTGEWQKIEFKEELRGPVGGKWISAPRLLLEKARAGQRFFIGPVTFQAIE